MNIHEINDLIAKVDYAKYKREESIVETGEVTEEYVALDELYNSLSSLLNTDGVDSLGRWYKAQEDRKKTLKAEKDYITRQMAALDNTLDYIKAKIDEIMAATGCEKVKGILGYSFARSTSVKTEVDRDLLRDFYQAKVEDAVKDILPADVTVSLSASVSKLEEGAELPAYYHREETPTVRVTKPRASKE